MIDLLSFEQIFLAKSLHFYLSKSLILYSFHFFHVTQSRLVSQKQQADLRAEALRSSIVRDKIVRGAAAVSQNTVLIERRCS